MAELRRYDPMRGDYALDLPAQPGPAASNFDRLAWWLSNLDPGRLKGPFETAGIDPMAVLFGTPPGVPGKSPHPGLLEFTPLLGMALARRPSGPKQIGSIDDILRDIRARMAMLLRGKAPVREADPEIVRELTKFGQRATPMQTFRPGRGRGGYQERVPTPSLPRWVEEHPYSIGPNLVTESGFPILSMKSEWWNPPEQSMEAYTQVRRLKDLGLWP